ncbi:MAG: MFS transporter [Gemmataceae bacterium]
MNLKFAFRALAHRNFQLFFAGQTISLIGTWMQQVAMAWLVFLKTRGEGEGQSTLWLGVVGFTSQVPAFFLAPVAGVLVDHWNRHRLILTTQTLAMVQAFILAGLTLSGIIEVWHILALSIFIGLINAFDMPARQAFLSEMIGNRDDLANAIALNSSMFNGARLIGPALAGLILAQRGPAFCFLLNAVSFVAVLIALWVMRVAPRPRRPTRPPLIQGLREGFRYAFGFPPIRSLLIQVAMISMAGMAYSTLLPVYATLFSRPVLGGDAGTFGFLTTAAGIGALTGAIYLAVRKNVLGLGRWVMIAGSLCGLGMLAFSFAGSVWLAMALLAVIGFGMMVQMGASNTMLQTIVDEDKRGRVLSLYTMAFMGMAPLGSLIAGSLADWIGPNPTLRVSGLACLTATVIFALQYQRLRSLVRPIYIKMGILPEMASSVYPTLAPAAPLNGQPGSLEPAVEESPVAAQPQ